MQFCSLEYIISFLALLLAYWALCKNVKAQNLLLLIASYAFYALWDWRCLILLLITSLSAYIAGLLFITDTGEFNKPKKKRNGGIAFAAIAVNLGILAVFKYFNFFVESFCDIFKIDNNSTINIILPVGISFFTFSAISYIVDVKQSKIPAVKDVVVALLYTSFFPAILSGPIHKATEQIPQYLKKRELDPLFAIDGFKLFVWGAFMKLCVADRIGMYVDAVYGNISHHNGTSLLMAAIFYSLQIYADFAGYSNMAIGCGKMLGIRLQTNFNHPYFAKTITEFWSRWHISLTSWFKNYVYIPLGGNRVSKGRWICNIMIVFLLSGLWHGAAYNFIIWGAMHGLLQVLEKLIYRDRIKRIDSSLSMLNVIRIAFTFILVTIAWIYFRLPYAEATLVVSKIFTSHGLPFLDLHTLLFFVVSFALLFVKDVFDEWIPGLSNNLESRPWWSLTVSIFLVAFILLVGNLDAGAFIYFQF